MNTKSRNRMTPLLLALTLGAGLVVSPVHAEERHEVARHEGFHTKHMIFDDRHGHGHYYPTVGYVVPALPVGSLTIGFGSRRLFFQAGVWYEPVGRGYTVVRPPVGVVVPILPPGYATVVVAGGAYFYANETYYVSAPGGYVVANPPTTYIQAPSAPMMAPPAPAMAPPTSSAPQPTGGTWYFCTSANAYYPYVAACPEGWKVVPASAPPGR